MKLHKVEDKLPEDNEYVLIHLNITNWHDNDDPEGNRFWRVAKFRRGLLEAEREFMDDDNPKKRSYCSADEGGNNQMGYCWEEFGPSSHFGQDVDKWAYLPISAE